MPFCQRRKLTGNEKGGPADDHEVVLPADSVKAHRSCLEEDEGGWVLLGLPGIFLGQGNVTYKQTVRTARIPFRWTGSQLGRFQKHRDTWSCRSRFWIFKSVKNWSVVVVIFLPLERQIQEHEKDTESVSDPVGRTGIFSCHCSQARCCDNDTDKAGDVHAASGVDLVMEPGSERVVNDTCQFVSSHSQLMRGDRLMRALPAVVNQTALSNRGIPPVMPRLVYRITA